MHPVSFRKNLLIFFLSYQIGFAIVYSMQNRRIFICLTHLAVSGLRPTFSSAFSPASITLNSPIQAKSCARLFSTEKTIMSPAAQSSSQYGKKTFVRVVSYNILSSELAEPDYHTLCSKFYFTEFAISFV